MDLRQGLPRGHHCLPSEFPNVAQSSRAPAERGRLALARPHQSSCPDLAGACQAWMETLSLGLSAAQRASSTDWLGEEIMGTDLPRREPASQAMSLSRGALLGPLGLSSSPEHTPSLSLIRVPGAPQHLSHQTTLQGVPHTPSYPKATGFTLQPLDNQGVLTPFQL